MILSVAVNDETDGFIRMASHRNQHHYGHRYEEQAHQSLADHNIPFAPLQDCLPFEALIDQNEQDHQRQHEHEIVCHQVADCPVRIAGILGDIAGVITVAGGLSICPATI